jgi:cytochrome c oxidase cbb3-type subunit III
MTLRAILLAVVLLAPVAVSHRQDDAKALFDQSCMQCHGVRGHPPRAMKASLPNIPTFDSAFIAVRTDDSIVTVLTRGKNGDMPSFKGKLTPAQMAVLAKYVRTLALK